MAKDYMATSQALEQGTPPSVADQAAPAERSRMPAAYELPLDASNSRADT